ncbi:hypothetical protein KCN56_04655 [Photobacterium galatheae]|uniref:Uncharacterized protein n=2 Tax=Photobacterium galatheae TaxID=1654360 RepID=A0A066RIZ2_9GAMM|nr:hypothetical protein EA58_16985 [Photobacterium galatheae]MCM0147860.1 hypothetical protein [Photobacterium galatheae]
MNYYDFLGKTYEELVKDPSFTSLIGGNVPSKIDGYDDEFYIELFNRGLEFQFYSEENKLKLIIAYNPAYFEYGLKGIDNRKDIHDLIGMPSESMLEKTVPVLGMVGAWDKFVIGESKYFQVVYHVGSDKVKCIHYLMGS